MMKKLYRVMVSVVVEAYDEEDACREVMRDIYDDTLTIEGVTEIACSISREEKSTSAIA